MTYWFVSFLWRRAAESSWAPAEATVQGEHPIGYVMRLRANYPETLFKVLFFCEIPPEVYQLARQVGV